MNALLAATGFSLLLLAGRPDPNDPNDPAMVRAREVLKETRQDDPNVPSALCSGERLNYLLHHNYAQMVEEWQQCADYLDQRAGRKFR